MDRSRRAASLVRAILALGDGGLRMAYVVSVARALDTAALARVLDEVCERAEQTEAQSREALIAIVDALNAEGMEGVTHALRLQAASESLLALDRLIRQPSGPPRTGSGGRKREIVPADAKGRPLTLGERKSLARRPDRSTLQRLFADPDPAVMRRLLQNPRLTEDDVVRFAAQRPGRSGVIAEIARAVRWAHRPRVRMALVMNPATPIEMAVRIAGLLLRPELLLVARSPAVPAVVRAVCMEHLERRLPVPSEREGRRKGQIH